MADAAKILDRNRFESRARIADFASLGLLIVSAAALVFDMYTFGYYAAVPDQAGGIVARDQYFIRMLIESFLAACALGWIAFRLFTASVRRVGGHA